MMYVDVESAARYTLVVGAGINANRNVPGWAALVRHAWHEVFGAEKHYRRDCMKKLTEARVILKERCGWSQLDLERLDLPIHPLEAQFALELIDLELRDNPTAAERVRRLVTESQPRVKVNRHADLLSILLARCLYERVRRYEKPDTLSELARFVRRSKRLIRVISLNVDDLLEVEVQHAKRPKNTNRSLQVISRHRHRPGVGIPTYHVHGFLPLSMLEDIPGWATPYRRPRRHYKISHMIEPVPEGIVFTDAQYWQSVATPLSFANFVFANALHDSSCIFVGLSMTDLNIIRWLGLNTIEFRREYERELKQTDDVDYRVPNPYIRHCWIRPDSSDPTGLITSFLARRGVYTRALSQWGPEEVRSALDELLHHDDKRDL